MFLEPLPIRSRKQVAALCCRGSVTWMRLRKPKTRTSPEIFCLRREKAHDIPFPHAILGENNSTEVLDNTTKLVANANLAAQNPPSLPVCPYDIHRQKFSVVLAENLITTPKR